MYDWFMSGVLVAAQATVEPVLSKPPITQTP